ncbi:MAG: hypothetical protein KIT09_05965 [Bryobacteraceae bacterium]|nr:hypothetical protein [Bryobacteraceae bacterium]
MPKLRNIFLAAGLFVVAALLIAPGGSLLYYRSTKGEGCARCHEIRPSFDMWAASTHRTISCNDCHGGLLTPDADFHASNLRRLVRHVRDDAPQQILMSGQGEIERLTARCQECHQREYAAWKAGPHSATYADIFTDAEHNRKRLLMDDCLRCHGMHFQGGIEDLVTPVATEGPWKLVREEMAGKPTMPCVTCHEVHKKGQPLGPRAPRKQPVSSARQAVAPASLGLFDRRTKVHVAVDLMPVPQIYEGGRPVKMSPDPRQALCYQCHAPEAGGQAWSGDDRTGLGVHEGISCLACHDPHTQQTRASCATCHPRLSNCGLDVEKMDTTFKDPASKHNVHTVKCADCHPKGVPPKRNRGLSIVSSLR